jgi:RNA polymerase sigma-70 factor (ECF subfamily)
MLNVEDDLTPGQAGMDILTEAEAIRLAQQGDDAGFKRTYELHSRRVYALCLRMTGSKTDAEDLTQEAFLQTFRKIHTFRGESAFSTWLHRLSVNVVLMHFRTKSLADTSVEEMGERDDLANGPRREYGGPDLRLTGLIDRLSLHGAINQLPPGYRMVFLLHDVEGYRHGEIALMLGCSVGNSKSQLHKARMRLRGLLENPVGHTVPYNTVEKIQESSQCEFAAQGRM